MAIKTIFEDQCVRVDRKEVFNHRTTPLVSWVVICKQSNLIVRETETKREAFVWVAILQKKEANRYEHSFQS